MDFTLNLVVLLWAAFPDFDEADDGGRGAVPLPTLSGFGPFFSKDEADGGAGVEEVRSRTFGEIDACGHWHLYFGTMPFHR